MKFAVVFRQAEIIQQSEKFFALSVYRNLLKEKNFTGQLALVPRIDCTWPKINASPCAEISEYVRPAGLMK